MKKASVKFDKELFKRSVESNVKTLFRKTLEEANEQQIFQAVSYAIKQVNPDVMPAFPITPSAIHCFAVFKSYRMG